MKFALIGNSPSSGSSFLADLLDSSEYSACGEELGIFSNTHLYQFDEFKRKPILNSNLFSLYFARTYWFKDYFYQYGLNEKELFEFISSSKSVQNFCEKFSEHFLRFRGKNIDGVTFEKTPNNNNTIQEFLDTNPESYFISIVRNPIYVYRSLKRRGLKENIALANWMFEAAKSSAFINHERVITIKYEELVQDPFKITSDIIFTCSGHRVEEKTLKDNYENNEYRQKYGIKVAGWSNKKHGKVVNANLGDDLELLRSFRAAMDLSIHPKYAKLFNLPVTSFKELMKVYDYSINFDEIENDYKKFKFNADERKIFYHKWKRNFKNGDAKITAIKTYINPVKIT